MYNKIYTIMIGIIVCIGLANGLSYTNITFNDSSGATNYSIKTVNTVWIEEYNITTQGWIQLTNVTSNSTVTAVFNNTNKEVNSRLDLKGIYTDVLCYEENKNLCNGTSSVITSNDYTIGVNITIPPNTTIYFFNKYNVTQGSTRPNDPCIVSGDTYLKTISGCPAITAPVIVSGGGSSGDIVNIDIDGEKKYYADTTPIYENLTGGGYEMPIEPTGSTIDIDTIGETNAFGRTFQMIMTGLGAVISIAILGGTVLMYYFGKMEMKTFIKCLIIEVIMFMIAGIIVYTAMSD